MSDIPTEVWTNVGDLVKAGWLERAEVAHALTFGLSHKPGIGRKIVEELRARAAESTHRREQATMHHFHLTRVELGRLLRIGRLNSPTAAGIQSIVGGVEWLNHYQQSLVKDGWLIFFYRSNGTIKKIEITSALADLITYYDTWEESHVG